MEVVKIKTEYIKLDQFLKWTGICYSGTEAKTIISEGQIKLNGNTEIQRGRKLRNGDVLEYNKVVYRIVSE